MVTTQIIDFAIISSYFIVLLCIGLINYSSKMSFKYTKKNTNRFTGLILIATIFSSSVGGGTTLGLMQKVFLNNMAYVYGIIMSVPFDILIGFVLMPKIAQHYGKMSVGDILEKNYGAAGKIIAGASATIISIGYIAAQVSVSSYIFEYLLNINKIYGIVISYGIIMIYTSFGGLKSVLYTNLMQFFGIIIGVPLIGIILYSQIGLEFLVHEQKYSFTESKDLVWSSIFIALNFSFALLTPNFVQRGLLSQDFRVSQRALLIKSFIYVIFIIITGINGLLIYSKYSMLNLSGHSFENFIKMTEGFFVGAKGLIAVGLLAAATSTADSDLNIVSIGLYNDIYKSLAKKSIKYELIIFKLITLIIGALSIIIALRFQNIIDIIIFAASFWSPIIFVPLVCSFYNYIISKKQLVAISIITLVFCISWDLMNFEIKSMFTGVIFNLICFMCCKIFNNIGKIKTV